MSAVCLIPFFSQADGRSLKKICLFVDAETAGVQLCLCFVLCCLILPSQKGCSVIQILHSPLPFAFLKTSFLHFFGSSCLWVPKAKRMFPSNSWVSGLSMWLEFFSDVFFLRKSENVLRNVGSLGRKWQARSFPQVFLCVCISVCKIHMHVSRYTCMCLRILKSVRVASGLFSSFWHSGRVWDGAFWKLEVLWGDVSYIT